MTELPILFSGPMVRAILDGRKTQTRRIVKGIPDNAIMPRYYGSDAPREGLRHRLGWFVPEAGDAWPCNDEDRLTCPYGQPGDRLWVRETWALVNDGGWAVDPSTLRYRADNEYRVVWPKEFDDIEQRPRPGWRPSIHMPRWACRLTAENKHVRVERLQNISRGDCMAEGCPFPNMADGDNPIDWFRELWDSLNAKRGYAWDANPWVWVVEFKREKA